MEPGGVVGHIIGLSPFRLGALRWQAIDERARYRCPGVGQNLERYVRTTALECGGSYPQMLRVIVEMIEC